MSAAQFDDECFGSENEIYRTGRQGWHRRFGDNESYKCVTSQVFLYIFVTSEVVSH